MNNEKLSNSFMQKYDPLSDNFVVVENLSTSQENLQEERQRRFDPFSLFRARRESRVLQDSQPPAPPAAPTPPIQTPPVDVAVTLSKDIYNKLKILSSLYQSMAVSDPSNVATYNSLVSETAILENTMLSIYQLLSGNNIIPVQTQTAPILTGNICSDLAIIEKYLQSIIDDVISLQRSVNIQNVDRQLSIILATLFSQKSKLTSLHSSCGC